MKLYIVRSQDNDDANLDTDDTDMVVKRALEELYEEIAILLGIETEEKNGKE